MQGNENEQTFIDKVTAYASHAWGWAEYIASGENMRLER